MSFEVSNEPQCVAIVFSSFGLLETLKIKAVEIELRTSEYADSTSYSYGDINIKIENDTGENEGKKRRCNRKATLKVIFF